MPRRITLPSADDLFRATEGQETTRAKRGAVHAVPDHPQEPDQAADQKAQVSGRIKHDEKMTVYVTSDELLEIEQARLVLRRAHGLAVDRGRLVREAVALVLADLEENAEQSALVRRLSEE